MQRAQAAQQAAAQAAQLDSALDDVLLKRHRRDPFGDAYVSLATSAFGAAPPPQVGSGRSGRSGRRLHAARY